MADLQTIISLLNLLGFGGVGVFLYYLYKGLKDRIDTLTELAQEQKHTLEAVRGRADEMDRLKESYKNIVSDFEEMGDKLKKRRQELVEELESANQRKDRELARLTNLQLEEIEVKRQSLERLPELEGKLTSAVEELGHQLQVVTAGQNTSRERNLLIYLYTNTLLRSTFFPHIDKSQPFLIRTWDYVDKDDIPTAKLFLEYLLERRWHKYTEGSSESTNAEEDVKE